MTLTLTLTFKPVVEAVCVVLCVYVGSPHALSAGLCFPAFMAFSSLPEVARKIRLFLALAPVATITFSSSPMTKLSVFPEFLMWVRMNLFTYAH